MDPSPPGVFAPTPQNVGTIIVSAIAIVTASTGGAGAGAMLVPTFLLLLQFPPDRAIPLSNVTLIGAALANCLIASTQRHPLVDRPLIDWDLVVLMESLTMAGGLLGSYAGYILPDAVVLLMLVLSLAVLGVRTTRKGLDIMNKEGLRCRLERLCVCGCIESFDADEGKVHLKTTELRASQGAAPHDGQIDEQLGTPLVTGRANSSSLNPSSLKVPLLDQALEVSSGDESSEQQLELQLKEILEQERRTPICLVLSLVVCFGGVVLLNVFKGDGPGLGIKGLTCDSPGYWVLTALTFPWVLAYFLLVRRMVVRKTEIKLKAGYSFVEGDVRWDRENSIRNPVLCVTSGVFAGIFGLGGGLLKGPLLLELGVLPSVTAASISVMILFTSGGAVVGYASFGLLYADYSAFYFVWGFVWTILGASAFRKLVGRQRAQGLTVMCISLVIGISAVMMLVEACRRISVDPRAFYRVKLNCSSKE